MSAPRTILTLLILTGIISAGCEKQAPPPGPLDTNFVQGEFIGKRTSSSQDLYVIDLQGSGSTRLTYDGSTALYGPAVWSPDGSQIAFTKWNNASIGFTLHVMDADGENAEQLFATTQISGFSWSPDGEWMAYTRSFEKKIWLSKLDGSQSRVADCFVTGPPYVQWSPDGSQIAMSGHSPILSILEVATGEIQDYFDFNIGLNPVCWSPDGQRIATSSNIYDDLFGGGSSGKIIIKDLVNGATTQLARNDQYKTALAWTQDGDHVIYTEEISPTSFTVHLVQISTERTGKFRSKLGSEHADLRLD